MHIRQILLFTTLSFILVYIMIYRYNEEQLVKVFVINLDRSYMRKYSIIIQMYLHGINFNIFNAVNGSTYIFNDEERQLFSGIINEKREVIARNKNQTISEIEQMRNNVMACALSHISIWKKNIGLGPLLILEDDMIFYPNLNQNINTALKIIEQYDPDWHILWISSGDPGDREIISSFGTRFIYKMDPPDYIGQGAMGYILSNKGIKHFTRQLEEKGCFCGVDIFLLKTLDIRHAYGIYKPLIFAEFFDSTI
jgi:GR25 family glycosyltransferase involved in LPS biosynthesis